MKSLWLCICLLASYGCVLAQKSEFDYFVGLGFPAQETSLNHFRVYGGIIKQINQRPTYLRVSTSLAFNPSYYHKELSGYWLSDIKPELLPNNRVLFESARLQSKELDLKVGLQTDMYSQNSTFYAGFDIGAGVRQQLFSSRTRIYQFIYQPDETNEFWPENPLDESGYVPELREFEETRNYESYSLKISVQPFFGWYYDFTKQLRLNVQWSPEIAALKHFTGSDNRMLYQYPYDWRARLYNFDIMLVFSVLK